MTVDAAKPDTGAGVAGADPPANPAPSRPRKRFRGGGRSLIAQGEPVVWLSGAGLVICMSMVIGLLLLVLYQGATTFWPVPILQVTLVDGVTYRGEKTRDDVFELNYGSVAGMSGARRDAATGLLNPRLHETFAELISSDRLDSSISELDEPVEQGLLHIASLSPTVRAAPAAERNALLKTISELAAARRDEIHDELRDQITGAVQADQNGTRLFGLWSEMRDAEDAWLALPDPAAMSDALTDDDELLAQIWGSQVVGHFGREAGLPMHRQLLRTGNFELTNEHFNWVSDFEISDIGVTRPNWAVVLERQSWGRFYGTPTSLTIDGEAVATDPTAVWEEFEKLHPASRDRRKQRKRLEDVDTGKVSRRSKKSRLKMIQAELDYGKESPEWEAAHANYLEEQEVAEAEFAKIRAQIDELEQENERFKLVMATLDGQDVPIELSSIVRAYPANQLTFLEKVRIYFSRWVEFLLDDPREANSEGGVFPAIWGTVVLTILMSVAVVPFGVLAALYLREYAKAGAMVSTIRVAINNLAGVPSIVFGAFGFGFFCLVVGGSIDQLFFGATLVDEGPTFGKGGLLWASLTLALLTVPVVIVATEEALAAVPSSMREGSLACGATKWQTIRKIVLPRAMPGIMTGAILAMARGAGEVAPLMLVGAAKLAPDLPLDGNFPYVHLHYSFMHLGFHIYDVGFQSQNSEAAKPMVFTTTLLLIGIIAMMNLIAIRLRGRLRRKFEHSHF